MKVNFDACFDKVMQSEGGYVNDPADHGGETNLGVTIGAWNAYINRAIQPGEMAKLTKLDVKPFYKSMYWDKVRGDDLPVGVDYAVFDFAVNAGVARAAKFLQRAVGAVDDGVVGSGTLGRVAKIDPTVLLKNFADQKQRFYNGLATTNPTQQKFLKGWLARVDHVQTAATSMLA
jgi:lysozyme family protein